MSSDPTTKAVLLSSGLRHQIRKLHKEDGLSAEEIGQLLNTSAELVAEALRNSITTPTENEAGSAVEIEEALAPHQQRAIETLAEVMEYSDNEALRLRAAETVLEYRSGNKRPRQQEQTGGTSVRDINILIMQAAHSYTQQLSRSETVASKPVAIDVGPSDTTVT